MSGGGRRAGVNSGACIEVAVVFGTPTGRRRGGGGEGTGRRPGSIENIFEPLRQFFLIFTPDRVRRGGFPWRNKTAGWIGGGGLLGMLTMSAARVGAFGRDRSKKGY